MMSQQSSDPPSNAPTPAGPGQPSPPARRRTGGRGLSVLVLALVGGLIGGAVVALVGWLTGWATHNQAAASGGNSCAVYNVADKALPSVVTLAVRGESGAGTGSGVVYRLDSGDSVIVTNAHVVSPPSGGGQGGGGSGGGGGGATSGGVSGTSGGSAASAGSGQPEIRIQYADGHVSPGQLVGMDRVTDLAVVKAGDPDPAARPISVGDSESLRVGAQVVALGAPLGLSSTVTSGIVSATGRYIQVPTEQGAAHLVGAIQTDAAINPGNSGGALVNCRARLIGINTAGATPNGEAGSSGLGFAIPVALASPLVAELAEHGRVSHPTLGLRVQGVPPEMQSSAGGAVVVQAVLSGGPADKAGIVPGDVVTEVAGHELHSPDQLVPIELGLKVGERVQVTVVRSGRKQSLTLEAAAS